MSEDSRPEAAGRPALASTLAGDWGTFLNAVDRLPSIARQFGIERAVDWARSELSAALDAISLAEAPTDKDKEWIHNLRLSLHEGVLRVMVRRDYRGHRLRSQFKAAVEDAILAPTVRTVFRASAPMKLDASTQPYRPETEDSEEG